MTNHVKDLVGKKFGNLLVKKFLETRGLSKHSYWLCFCECGSETIVRGSHLKNGGIVSCGCYNRKRASGWLKKYATSRAHKGLGNPMWKGGVSKPNELQRKLVKYKKWRTAVFTRDNYQCVIGGKKHGGKLHADHIKSFAEYPELRFVLDNGRTLCVDCHKKRHETRS